MKYAWCTFPSAVLYTINKQQTTKYEVNIFLRICTQLFIVVVVFVFLLGNPTTRATNEWKMCKTTHIQQLYVSQGLVFLIFYSSPFQTELKIPLKHLTGENAFNNSFFIKYQRTVCSGDDARCYSIPYVFHNICLSLTTRAHYIISHTQ